jgi:hypothetical protein
MPKITMMASVSNGFPRSKNSIASIFFLEINESAPESTQAPKKCRYNSQWRKMIPKVKK